MLLDLRRDLAAGGHTDTVWNWGMKAWALGVSRPTRFNLDGRMMAAISNRFMPQRLPGPLAGWTDYRAAPSFARQSFRQLWQEREAQKGERDE